MKRLCVALALPLLALLTMSAAYPPGAPEVETDINPTAGQPAVVTVRGCAPGENVVFDLQGSTSKTAVCDDASVAAVSLDVPGTAGDYTGTATLETTDVVLAFVLGVSATNNGLAFTGTDVNYPIYLGVGAIAIGTVLVMVARTRRHDHVTV